MNVLMLAPEFLPVWGGVGTYCIELARNLRGAEIHVLTPKRVGFTGGDIENEYDFDDILPSNVHIHFLGEAKDTFRYNAKFQYACFKHVPRIIKEKGIDILHSHTAQMPDLFLSFRNLDIPILTTIHTTIKGQRFGTKLSDASFLELEFSEKMTYLMYPFLRLAEEIYFKKDRNYIVVSNWMKNQILMEKPGINPRKIFVVHNGTDPEIFNQKKRREYRDFFPELDDDRLKVLFSSRFVERKGTRFLFEAIPKILKEADVFFIFAGTGKGIKLDIPKKNYAFLGYVDYLKMPYLYALSDIFILTSLYENFPISLLEAMSSGLAVISTNVGGIPEVIHDKNGILIPPCNVDAIVEQILYLVNDEKSRKKIAENARKTIIENFTWELSAKKTMEVYEKMLE